jgi:hypothetical protein
MSRPTRSYDGSANGFVTFGPAGPTDIAGVAAGPAIAVEIRRLIERMVAANPLWGAPQIHGELKMLGIAISERTVSRLLCRLPRPSSQTWKTLIPMPVGKVGIVGMVTEESLKTQSC